MSSFSNEFQEIGHCGGQYIATTRTENGRRQIKFAFRHIQPTAASIFGVFALPQGIAVGPADFAGLIDPPVPFKCFPVFVGSDSEGMFGRSCRRCKGYWRTSDVSGFRSTTCVYCGLQTGSHRFLTEGQQRFVEGYCELIRDALQSEKDGEHVIDLDVVADTALKNHPKPKFYYAEESQQSRSPCPVCKHVDDVLGRYSYCSSCGTYKAFFEFEKELGQLRARIESVPPPVFSDILKEAVSAFDSFSHQISMQLAARIPMLPQRKKDLERQKFHNIKVAGSTLDSAFGINVFEGLNESDRDFVILMFHRRHLYEHNGGEVDDKYIRDSGDKSVKVKQKITETKEGMSRALTITSRLAKNLHEGFHKIFPAYPPK